MGNRPTLGHGMTRWIQRGKTEMTTMMDQHIIDLPNKTVRESLPTAD